LEAAVILYKSSEGLLIQSLLTDFRFLDHNLLLFAFFLAFAFLSQDVRALPLAHRLSTRKIKLVFRLAAHDKFLVILQVVQLNHVAMAVRLQVVGQGLLIHDFVLEALIHQALLSRLAIAGFVGFQTHQGIPKRIEVAKRVELWPHYPSEALNLLPPALEVHADLDAHVCDRQVNGCVTDAANENGIDLI